MYDGSFLPGVWGGWFKEGCVRRKQGICAGFPYAKDELHKAAYNGEAEKLPEGYKPYIAIALGYKKVPNGKAPARRAETVNYVKAEGQNIWVG